MPVMFQWGDHHSYEKYARDVGKWSQQLPQKEVWDEWLYQWLRNKDCYHGNGRKEIW